MKKTSLATIFLTISGVFLVVSIFIFDVIKIKENTYRTSSDIIDIDSNIDGRINEISVRKSFEKNLISLSVGKSFPSIVRSDARKLRSHPDPYSLISKSWESGLNSFLKIVELPYEISNEEGLVIYSVNFEIDDSKNGLKSRFFKYYISTHLEKTENSLRRHQILFNNLFKQICSQETAKYNLYFGLRYKYNVKFNNGVNDWDFGIEDC